MTRSPVPLYHQLKEMLVEKIESGEWQPGHQLPTEFQLSSEFSLSRATVRQAMQLLANQGLIERRQGSGTFVARPKISHNLLAMFTDGGDIRSGGTRPHIAWHSLRRRTPPQNVQGRLSLAANEKVWEVRRTILSDEEPLMLITSWLPCARFPDLDRKDLERCSFRFVMTSVYGVETSRQLKQVEVTSLDEEEAAVLLGHVGMPALLVTYLSFQADGSPYEYRKMVVRGDRSKYHVDLDVPEMLV